MKILKQSTYETCLACCLLMVVDGKRKDEIEIWKHGWEIGQYLIGQLNYVANKYGKSVEAYIENKYYFNQLENQKEKKVKLINKKIDTKLLGKLLENGPVILYSDRYNPDGAGYVHAPHFTLALEQKDKSFKIADPFDGKLKEISAKDVRKRIGSLRNHLKYSPVLVAFPQVRN